MARRNLARITAGLAFGALLFSATSALADERSEARVHFKKGMAAIAEGQYEAGIEDLKRAYEILPHPNVLFNIARAYVDVGDLESAVVYYQKYLEGSPKDRDEVAQVVVNLEARIRKQQAQLLETQQAQATPPPSPAAPSPSGAAGGPGAATAPGGTTAGVAKPAGGPGPKGGEGEGGSLKTEQLFEETVVTASRTAQSPLDAPNSTSIITEQDIRLSGITKLPELLRRLAGVDIMEVTGAQTEVSLRGFNQRLSNKVLVLIDGRSVYIDLLGATLWPALSISVEDVERIEVVRGPGSALYGADAFNGVINIITKAPGTGGSGFNVGYGTENATHGSIWASGHAGETAYRLSANYEYLSRWSREVPPGRADLQLSTQDQNASMRGERIDAQITRQLGNDVTVGLQGGFVDGTFEILGEGPINDVIIAGTVSDLMATLRSKHVEVRAFWNHNDGTNSNNAAYIGQSLLTAIFDTNVVDGEAQYIDTFETGKGVVHDLHVGAEYRLKEVHWSYLLGDETENHAGLFAHDAVKIGQRFAVVGDYRADFVPYLNRFVQSPRGSVLFHPSKQSTVRGIVATAFRTPTFLESYIGNFIQLPYAGGGEYRAPTSPKVQPEQIFTTELGYLNSESDYFTIDSAFFYNRASNLIEIAPATAITVGDLATPGAPTTFSPSTGLYPLFFGGYQNQCQKYDVYGAEIGARVFPIDGLDIYGNYTLMDVVDDQSACTVPQVADARTSMHKLNGGVQVRSKTGFDGEVDVHFVSPQTWAEQVIDVQKQSIVYQSYHLDAYALLNARVGYGFLRNKQAVVSVVAFNLLDNQHREHPFGQIIGRQIMGLLTYRF
ncbi:MAG: TonB-dependent receptor domain-containing protein [Polyangiaceae bacterium]